MGERGIEIGRDVDISGLLWVDRFGWIRAKEMGRLLWPRCNHSVKYAERIFIVTVTLARRNCVFNVFSRCNGGE